MRLYEQVSTTRQQLSIYRANLRMMRTFLLGSPKDFISVGDVLSWIAHVEHEATLVGE